jgi:hypothetical protein
MKNVSSEYKNNIKKFGKEIDCKVSYYENNTLVELEAKDLLNVSLHYEGALMKSVMAQLDIESTSDIPVEKTIDVEFGVKVGNEYEYITLGTFKVVKSEKQEDKNTYKLTCYDFLVNAMKDYKQLSHYVLTEDEEFIDDKNYYIIVNNEYRLYTGERTGNPSSLNLYEYVYVTFPLTIREYITYLCSNIGIEFQNVSDTFPNYDKVMTEDMFLYNDGSSLGYTYRDVLDQLAEVTASIICINSFGKLELRRIDNKKEQLTNKSQYNNTANNVSGIFNDSNGSIRIYGTADTSGNAQITLTQVPISITSGTKVQFSSVKPMPRQIYIHAHLVGGGYQNIAISSGSRSSPVVTLEGDIDYYNLRFSTVKNTSYDFTTYLSLIIVEDEPVVEEAVIDESSLKNINVKFGKKFGPINSIVLSRAGESDNVYRDDPESVQENGRCEIKIIDNQIMSKNDREDYLPDILEQLDGLYYYVNDFESTGITYLELGDRFDVSIDNELYSCLMLNDEINITQGLSENVFTELPEETETDYTKADKTDRRINETYIIVDKQNGEIRSRISTLDKKLYGDDGEQGDIDKLYSGIKETSDSITVEVGREVSKIIGDRVYEKTTIVKITEEGLNVSTSDSRINTQLDNDSFEIKDQGGTTLAFIGYDVNEQTSKAEMDNLTIKKYLTAGNHRIEKFERNYEDRTGFFYIGG